MFEELSWPEFVAEVDELFGQRSEELGFPPFEDPDIPAGMRLVSRILFSDPKQWFDTQVPVFDNQTPRQLVKTESGRLEVQAILQTLFEVHLGDGASKDREKTE